jgi:lipid-binding SYLF domain-containing protein
LIGEITMTVFTRCTLALAAVALMSPGPASAQYDRLNEAAVVLQEIVQQPDAGIPRDLFKKAECVVIVPGLKKGAFIVGGKYGRGFMSCRRKGGGWSAPGGVRVEGGSVGFQIGGTETDVLMLVMNPSGVDKLLSSKFTLGAEASAAAGPLGRNAAAMTDAQMRAEILSWSRARGVFAGISLDGATLRGDEEANKELYGRDASNRELVSGTVPPPAGAEPLMKELAKM